MNVIPLLTCPVCRQASSSLVPSGPSSGLTCSRCDCRFAIADGVIDLEPDADLDTQLDIEEYARANAGDSRLYEKCYRPFLRELGIVPEQSACLEIASGPGTLTLGLARAFRQVYASDLSSRFLAILRKRLTTDNVALLRFDAGHLPFKPSSVDVVVGHSVLHHFLEYEQTLEGCFRILRSGGVAVFGEPLYPAAAVTSLLAGVIRHAEVALPDSQRYPRQALAALERIELQTAETQSLMQSNRQALAAREDKHQFSLEGLRSLARDIGFSRFVSVPELRDSGELGAFRQGVDAHARRIEALVAPLCPGFTLKKHGRVLDVFERAYFDSFRAEPPPAIFSNFALVK